MGNAENPVPVCVGTERFITGVSITIFTRTAQLYYIVSGNLL